MQPCMPAQHCWNARLLREACPDGPPRQYAAALNFPKMLYCLMLPATGPPYSCERALALVHAPGHASLPAPTRAQLARHAVLVLNSGYMVLNSGATVQAQIGCSKHDTLKQFTER